MATPSHSNHAATANSSTEDQRVVLGDGTAANPCKVGCVDNANARVIRIVHLSDTHMLHEKLRCAQAIPDGDILIHSGDFTCYKWSRYLRGEADVRRSVSALNDFFSKLPHRHKIFVAGNHELNFPVDHPEKIQRLLTHGTYLQDSSAVIDGIHFYGSPWTGKRWYSFASAFTEANTALGRHWKRIPHDVDVLITHLPPFNILDTARSVDASRSSRRCDTCGMSHPRASHWGCPVLRDVVLQVRPKAHLFGHVHQCNSAVVENGVLFSNAALKLAEQPRGRVIDYFIDDEKSRASSGLVLPVLDCDSRKTCAIM